MEQAIRLAIEGGWNPHTPKSQFVSVTYDNGWLSNWSGEKGMPLQRWVEADLLSPLFWQALGEAEGWAGEPHLEWHLGCGHPDTCNCAERRANGETGEGEEKETGWNQHWHRFINHLAENKPIDDFFNNLLKK